MSETLLTGFPGFLATALLPRLLERGSGPVTCLVEPRYVDEARRRARALESGLSPVDGVPAPTSGPVGTGRIRLLPGDITRPGLGLEGHGPDPGSIREIHHLAAIYDLGVSRSDGLRVNRDGTVHVLRWAERCGRLRRLHYVSTCYVSGRYPGRFRETDLDVGQAFNNHYEETKFLAETAVREAMAGGLPATVYRPAVVVGDHRTGATQKFDGPYYFIRLLLRQRGVALFPIPGDPSSVRLNVLPRDVLVDLLDRISSLDESEGRTYHLADPDPPFLDAAIDAVVEAVGRPVLRVPVPAVLARGILARVPGARTLVGIPPEAMDYFTHPTEYDTENLERDVLSRGASIPSFPTYAARLVEYVRRHPRAGAAA